MSAELIGRAQAGDGEAFRQLVEPYRHELRVHCYRMLGSVEDADDTLQGVLLAAWQAIGGFEQRASLRTWLYRIATNRCLDARRARSRRARSMTPPSADYEMPEPTRLSEVTWLDPVPDADWEALPDPQPGPEARYNSQEAISLAFLVAVQHLPPRQRAVLLLRDVLGFHAREVAEMLATTEESVASALKRARASLERRFASPERWPAPPPNSGAEQEIVARLTRAFEAADVDGIVAILSVDVRLTMPPLPLEYQGRDAVTRFLTAVTRAGTRRYRLIPTRANLQPAFGFYMREPQADVFHALGLLVLTLDATAISDVTLFDNSALARFGLPRTLPH